MESGLNVTWEVREQDEEHTDPEVTEYKGVVVSFSGDKAIVMVPGRKLTAVPVDCLTVAKEPSVTL